VSDVIDREAADEPVETVASVENQPADTEAVVDGRGRLTLALIDRVVRPNNRLAVVVLIGLAITLRLVFFGASFVQLSLDRPGIDLAINQTPTTATLTETYERLAGGDPSWYLDIASHGYTDQSFTTEKQMNWGFFPGWPALIRASDPVLPGDLFAASVILANALSLVAIALVYMLLRLDFSATLSFASVALLIVSPGGFHLGRPGSEALFLLLTVGAFYFARRDQWAIAGLAAGLAAFTRPNGIVLLPALAVLYLVQLRRRDADLRRPRSWLNAGWLALVPLGLLSFMWYLQHLTGNFMAYFDQKRVNWDWENRAPFLQLIDWFRHPTLTADWGWDLAILSASLLLLLTAVVVIGLVRWRDIHLPLDYWVFIVASVIMLASRNSVAGVSRYGLAVFPIFTLVVLLLRRRVGTLAIVGSALLVIQTFLFVFSNDLQTWAN
jgi:hypothetical protein